MKNPIRALLERDERRWQTHGLTDWERRRAGGKWMFVLKFGFLWGLITFGVVTVIGDIQIRGETLWFNLVTYLSVGLTLGLFMWWEGERKYQKHLKEEFEKNLDDFPADDALYK